MLLSSGRKAIGAMVCANAVAAAALITTAVICPSPGLSVSIQQTGKYGIPFVRQLPVLALHTMSLNLKGSIEGDGGAPELRGLKDAATLHSLAPDLSHTDVGVSSAEVERCSFPAYTDSKFEQQQLLPAPYFGSPC